MGLLLPPQAYKLNKIFASGASSRPLPVTLHLYVPNRQHGVKEQGDWENRTIFLQFDIEYSHKERGTVKERLHFVGKRVWLNTYKWTVGPIIEG